jgi:thiamine biosynthesis protein ThiI
VKYETIIIRYGEIGLKGRVTRKNFEQSLINNIKNALQTKQIPHTIKKEWGRIYVYTDQINKSIPILQRVFGITSISPVPQTQSTMDAMSKLSINISKEVLTKEKSFAMRVTRTGKHNFTSQDVAVKIGSDVVKATNAFVNLTKPDFELFIEIRDDDAFIFTEKIRGTGGLPLGTQGKVLSVIDGTKSILAAWYLMRRGCKTDFVTTTKIYDDMLRSFTENWNAHADVVHVTIHEKELYKKLNKIASEKNCDAIVTGHTLYEKQSYCLSDIKLLKQYSEIPILNPLISMDKKTINKKCKEIGLKL